MTDDPNYLPERWEVHPRYHLLEEMDDEEYDAESALFPYGGYNLRQLRSQIVEGYLAGEHGNDRQPGLFDERSGQGSA